MSLFWVDEGRQTTRTWDAFFADLKQIKSVPHYLNQSNPYDLFLHLVRSVIAGLHVTVLDSDFSSGELARLALSSEELAGSYAVPEIDVSSFEACIAAMENGKATWRLRLYSSGTTGIPKAIVHEWSTLTRLLRSGEKYRRNVWALAYNPTHIAGIQVFWQAFVNHNTIVYVFDAPRERIPTLIREHAVSHISASPTFYRTVLSWLDGPIPSVERVTLGGEKYDSSLLPRFAQVFPQARVTNIYASTEIGSLLVTGDGDSFSIPPELAARVIVDADGQLKVHRSLLANLENASVTDEWYATGDLVERISEESFRFVGRKSDVINIGGYKVNPHEIEDRLRCRDEVIDVRVAARATRVTGNILIAEVVAAPNVPTETLEAILVQYLEGHLQPWKIPRVFKFVPAIAMTRTGKLVREGSQS